MKFQIRRVCITSVFSLTILFAACGRGEKKFSLVGDENQKDDSENFIIPSTRARIVPLEKVAAFSFSEDSAVIRIQKSLRGISTGYSAQSFAQEDVLVIPPSPAAPQGAIRKIVGVKDGPGEVFLSSGPATLTEAITDARVEADIAMDKLSTGEQFQLLEHVSVEEVAPGSKNAAKFSGISVNLKDFVLSDIDGDRKTHEDQLKLDASLSMERKGRIVLLIKGGQLEEFSFSLKGRESSRFALSGFLNIPLSKQWPIFKARYSPMVLTIAGFPLVFTPTVLVELTSQLTPTGDISVSGDRESSFQAGLRWFNSEFTRINEYEHSGAAVPPYVQIPKAKVQTGFRVKADLSLYESLGAYAGVKFAIGTDFHLRESDCYETRANGNAFLGVYLQLLSIKLGLSEESWTLLDKELARGKCLPSEIPGGDPRTFAWRYRQTSSPGPDSSRSAINFDSASQGGLALVLPREISTPLFRFAANGSLQLARQEQAKIQMGQIVKSLADGGQLLAGDSASGLMLERSDSSGRTLWSWQFKFPDEPKVIAVEVDSSDGSFYISGTMKSSLHGPSRLPFVSRFSEDGQHQWTRTYSAELVDLEIRALRVMPNGRIAVGGQISDEVAVNGVESQAQRVGWVAMLEPNGQAFFSKRIANGSIVSISEASRGKSQFVILGYREEISGTGVVHKPWLVGMNLDGGLTMVTAIGTTVHPNSVSQYSEGYLIAGTWNNQAVEVTSNDDGWLCSVGHQGEVQWSRKIFSSKPDGLKIALQIPGNRLLLGGFEEAEMQVRPVVFNLPIDGTAEFVPTSGFLQTNENSPRDAMKFLDSYQPISTREIDGVTRVPMPLQFRNIEDAIIERIGRY